MIFQAKEYKRHDSMRGWFAYELYLQMLIDKNIWLIVGDLGFKIFDPHFKAFPTRCINVGAAETTLIGVGVGLALEGKKPFCYSITTFLLRRPYETIKLYIDHEKIPVRLVGSGRDHDYAHDGISHWSEDDKDILSNFKSIFPVWPKTKEQIPDLVGAMVENNKPWYINLTR